MIFHRLGACVSRVPRRMVVPAESVTVSVFAVKRAVQPALHSVPTVEAMARSWSSDMGRLARASLRCAASSMLMYSGMPSAVA